MTMAPTTDQFEQALSLAGFYEPQWIGDKGDLLKLFEATAEVLKLSTAPEAYLLTFARPGMRSQYASVSADERRDNLTDHEWVTRKVEPLFTRDTL